MFEEAIAQLKQGHVIALPTEAVYGLSVDARNDAALKRLLDLKKRNPEKGLIIVGSDFSQLEPFIQPLSADVYHRLMATWPGPVTWVVPARADVSALLRGKHGSVAIRVTSHPVFSALCAAFGGALVSTSANPEGQPPAMSAQQVSHYFGTGLHTVAGALGGLAKPTEIRDAMTGLLIRA